MLPITVDFLFDGRNTRFSDTTIGTFVEGKIFIAKQFRKMSLVDWIHEKLVILELRTKARTNVPAIWIITANDIRWRMYGRWKIEKADFILLHEFILRKILVCIRLLVSRLHVLHRDRLVEKFSIPLPGETSAFLAILYYLWMFICCSIGVPL